MKIALAIAALLAPVVAQGSAHSAAPACRIPPSVAPEPMPAPDGPRRTGPTTGTTLAISWSPQFCRTHPADPWQCDGRLGHPGFVLHGLWADGLPGQWPQWCAAQVPSAETLRRNLCMTPSPRLLTHEWAKHGSCMAPTPEAYFAQARAAYAAVRLPDAVALSRKPGLTAGDLRRAFIRRNRGLTPASIRISASDGGWLQEVQLCADNAGRPKACMPQGMRDGDPLRIWRGE